MSEPIYPRLLGLKHIHPNAWQRAVLGEGMVFLGFLLSPGSLDVAPWKAMLVLPLAVALVVKAHDVVTGLLPVTARVKASDDLWAILLAARELALERSRAANGDMAPFALVDREGQGRVDVLELPDAQSRPFLEQLHALRVLLHEVSRSPDSRLRSVALVHDARVTSSEHQRQDAFVFEVYEREQPTGLLVTQPYQPSAGGVPAEFIGKAIVVAKDVPSILLATGAHLEDASSRYTLDVDGSAVTLDMPAATHVLSEDELVQAVLVGLAELGLTPQSRTEPAMADSDERPAARTTVEVLDEPTVPRPQPEPHDGPTSAELWAMVEAARELSDGEELPFVLVSSPRGPVSVGADVGLLTPQERAGALRAGLEQSRPERAVLAYRAGDGVQLAAYETGRGVLVGDDLSVLTADLPPLL